MEQRLCSYRLWHSASRATQLIKYIVSVGLYLYKGLINKIFTKPSNKNQILDVRVSVVFHPPVGWTEPMCNMHFVPPWTCTHRLRLNNHLARCTCGKLRYSWVLAFLILEGTSPSYRLRCTWDSPQTQVVFETTEKKNRYNPLPWDTVTGGCNSSQVSYLGENGEMSWLSLAQVMMGGGELFTSQGRVTSSPARAAISTGLSWDRPLWSPNTLGLTKINACFGREIVHWKHSIYNTMCTANILKSFIKMILLISGLGPYLKFSRNAWIVRAERKMTRKFPFF